MGCCKGDFLSRWLVVMSLKCSWALTKVPEHTKTHRDVHCLNNRVAHNHLGSSLLQELPSLRRLMIFCWVLEVMLTWEGNDAEMCYIFIKMH